MDGFGEAMPQEGFAPEQGSPAQGGEEFQMPEQNPEQSFGFEEQAPAEGFVPEMSQEVGFQESQDFGLAQEEYDPMAAYSANQEATEFGETAEMSMPVEDAGVLMQNEDAGDFYVPTGPTAGYFAPDGTYVPPSDFEQVQEDPLENDPNNALRTWEAEQQEHVLKVDEEERAAINEREADARMEIEKLLADREKRIAVTKEQNQVHEQNFIADRDTPVDAKNLWDRVTKLIDVKPGSEKDPKSDVTRFRSLLLQLKHNPI